jgi:Ni,Fe-hydrogenase maturation factor
VPSTIRVVAVEVLDMETVGEGLTPEVGRAVPAVAEAVRRAVAALS